jgi:hypothetical protein
MDKEIIVRVVKEAKHAWDKPAPKTPKPSVHVEYGHAVESMRRWVKLPGLPGLSRENSTVSQHLRTTEEAVKEQLPADDEPTPNEKADFRNSDLQLS